MYAVKETNLVVTPNTVYYTPAHDYTEACQMVIDFRNEIHRGWVEGRDYRIEVVDDLPEDFDFESQSDWN